MCSQTPHAWTVSHCARPVFLLLVRPRSTLRFQTKVRVGAGVGQIATKVRLCDEKCAMYEDSAMRNPSTCAHVCYGVIDSRLYGEIVCIGGAINLYLY
jgi:hypothetical protein